MDELPRLEDLFKVVIEPDHSRGILLNLQNRYQLNTQEFLRLYYEGIPLPMPTKDIDNWLFEYEMFIACEGDLGELGSAKEEENDDPFLWKETINRGQPIKKTEEVNRPLLSFFFG